jgi:hypothetical protein
MWVRAVAAALAVWCVSGAAMAAGYTEVWNPPEASRHAVGKPAKKKPGAVKAPGKVKVGAGSKANPTRAARAQHKAPQVAAARHGDKPVAQGGVKKVAVKGGVKQAGVGKDQPKARPKAAVIAQAKKPHARLVRADLSHPARPHAIKVAAKTGAAKPAVSHPNVSTPIASANYGGGSADVSTNPATASSGSLPPIIH